MEDGPSDGLERLTRNNLLHLSVEHLVSQDEWKRLFGEHKIESARKKLLIYADRKWCVALDH